MKEKENLSISIVICTMNRPRELEDCLKSILIQSMQPYEIAIIDCSRNGKTNDLIQAYQHKFSCPVMYVHTKPGLTSQRNIGVKKTTGEIVTFLDDDVVVDKKYLSEIEKLFHLSQEVIGVGGRIVNNENNTRFQNIFKALFMLTSDSGKKGKMKRSGFANFQFNCNKRELNTTQVFSGCNCSYRRSLFSHHMFDEYFDGYGLMEDVEFSYRISKYGELIYNPKAEVLHERVLSGKPNFEKLFMMNARNHRYVFQKLVLRNKIDWLFFLWSRLGMTFHFIAVSIKNRCPITIINVINLLFVLK